MSRALFGRGAKGALIEDLQLGLADKGIAIAKVDGVFGQGTEQAVRAYQANVGSAQTGAVSMNEWVSVTGKPVPALAERCLQITAAFEGHNYTLAAGNWDDAWLTWGIVGFTMKFGRVQEIVRSVEATAPECIRGAFGSNADILLGIVHGPASAQEAWAAAISTPDGHHLVEPWQTAFARFGEFPPVRAAQRQCAFDNYFTPAVRTASTLSLTTELGIALCFDIHVQNGGVATKVREALLPVAPDQPEPVRRERLANAVADHSLAKFRENVRSRKLAFATGAGTANGVNVTLMNWGLDETVATV